MKLPIQHQIQRLETVAQKRPRFVLRSVRNAHKHRTADSHIAFQLPVLLLIVDEFICMAFPMAWSCQDSIEMSPL